MFVAGKAVSFNGFSNVADTYDANGNMLTGDGATYTYDARDRQSSYVKGSTLARYTYYPTGLRKSKISSLAVTNYAWDGGNMVLEYTGSAAAGKVYVYGLTLISQGNSWYYIYNAHGDVVKYINAAGAVLKSYDYDAFGEEVVASTTDANPFRYAGQYFDSETGTYYLRARYYNPGLGRFTQQDAWGYGDPSDPLSLNLYVYCYGNPVFSSPILFSLSSRLREDDCERRLRGGFVGELYLYVTTYISDCEKCKTINAKPPYPSYCIKTPNQSLRKRQVQVGLISACSERGLRSREIPSQYLSEFDKI